VGVFIFAGRLDGHGVAKHFETQAALRGMERRRKSARWSKRKKFERTLETVRKISSTELMRYKIGSNGMRYRAP
jgi:hypothetical protein